MNTAIDPSYDYSDLLLIEQRQKLVLALEQYERVAPSPTPLEQYKLLLHVLHITPCPEYIKVLESYHLSGTDAASVDFRIEKFYVSPLHWIAIFLTISNCHQLATINVTSQRLTSVLVVMLCDAVADLPLLRSLDISRNPCGSTGVKALIRLAKKKPQLVYCGFSEVHCISTLSRQLEEVLRRNSQSVILKEESSSAEGEEEPQPIG